MTRIKKVTSIPLRTRKTLNGPHLCAPRQPICNDQLCVVREECTDMVQAAKRVRHHTNGLTKAYAD